MNLQKFNITHLMLFTLLFVSVPRPSNALLEDVLDVIHFVKEITKDILEAWDMVQQTSLGQSIEFSLLREEQIKVLQRLKEVSRQIDDTESKYAHRTAAAIESINDFIAENIPLMARMKDITDTVHRISARYQEMQKYELHKDALEVSTLVTFAEWTVAPNADSVHHQMDVLHYTLLGTEEKANTTPNLLSLLAQNYEESTDQICHTQQSAQQFLYSLYTDIALTELKGYTMMEFSWMMLRAYGKGNFTQEAELMRMDYEKRVGRTLKLLQQVMRRADRIVWRCDPSKYIKGQNYDEITRLLQGFVENEVDMNDVETCRENCDFYQSTKSQGCFKHLYCAQQPRCSGKLYQCTYVDSDMWICPAASNSTRRYEYIEYENGRLLGKRNTCVRGTTKVDSWWRYLFWHCSYCFCLCDEQGLKSDRYFNLRESLSDTQSNKVVTGLRFIKKNRIFHLQIQEGELLQRGVINATTLTWKPTDDYQIFDRDVRKGVDYHTLNYKSRTIDLDDIYTDDKSFVVTGVRFRKLGAHLNLEGRLTEMDFATGKLISPVTTSFWKSNDNTDVSGEKRIKIELISPDLSSDTLIKSLPDSRHNQYIDFVNTNMDKDAAQSTVPFIDIQDVVPNPPVPLSGIGIYHKGRDGFGGFLAPKVITYDFSPHVKMVIKVTNQRKSWTSWTAASYMGSGSPKVNSISSIIYVILLKFLL